VSRPGIRSAQIGILVNAALATTKFVAGLVGSSYALVADAVESTTDILASLVVWGGLQVASREPDESHPFGYGKAEPLAAAVVALFVLGAAVAIGLASIREIRTPHHAPAPWTLGVLVAVIVVKATLSRRVQGVGRQIGSTAVEADAAHHFSDAITSAAAFVGISVALLGGPGWESADDWAALFAAGIIAFNGVNLLRRPLNDLMDAMPEAGVVERVRAAAEGVPGVLRTEKLAIRRTGLVYRVTIHVQAAPSLTLHEAHVLSGMVKSAIRDALPEVQSVLVHMEPFEEDKDRARRTGERGVGGSR
jgi:cation diffusion facilitator family transporter